MAHNRLHLDRHNHLASNPLRNALQAIDGNSFILGTQTLIKRIPLSDPACKWEDGKGGGFAILEAPSPLPELHPLDTSSDTFLYSIRGSEHAVFRVGEAFLKVLSTRPTDRPGDVVPEMTREHVTLSWMNDGRDWTFKVPKVLHHDEYDGVYYLIMDRVPGSTIDDLWPTFDADKKLSVCDRIADICREITDGSPQGTKISGIDGGYLYDPFLLDGTEKDFSPDGFARHCSLLGMDCSTLYFWHNDLNPNNILLDEATDTWSFVDWECAGFIPLEWIPTKVESGAALTLWSIPDDGDYMEYCNAMGGSLKRKGFPEVQHKYEVFSRNFHGTTIH